MKNRYAIVLYSFLSLVLIGCKEQPKNENGVDKTASEMWNDFIKSNPEFKNEDVPESDFFHDNKKDANRLAELTRIGKKRASSGLYVLYQQYNVELPKVGKKQIVTDFDGKAQAIIKTKSVATIPFIEISKEYAAWDMGTDIESLKKWRKAHWNFFKSVMEQNGKKPTEEMLVVCETFETIWPELIK